MEKSIQKLLYAMITVGFIGMLLSGVAESKQEGVGLIFAVQGGFLILSAITTMILLRRKR